MIICAGTFVGEMIFGAFLDLLHYIMCTTYVIVLLQHARNSQDEHIGWYRSELPAMGFLPIACSTLRDLHSIGSWPHSAHAHIVWCLCMQGATVYAMRYLATVVAQCFTAFGDILQLYTSFFELSGGVARVSHLIKASRAALELQQSIALTNISDTPLAGALQSLAFSRYVWLFLLCFST
jgi:hypothetical protein